MVVTFSILSTVAESIFAQGLTAKISEPCLLCGDYKLEEIPHNADNNDHIGMIQYHSCAVRIHK